MSLVSFINTKPFFSEKTLEKLEYFSKMIIFLVINESIWAFLVKYIIIKLKFIIITCLKEASIFLFSVVLADSFLFMSSTYLVVNRASLAI